jgi:hypothetical protein
MAIRIQIRNDVAQAWTDANPILMQGEMGNEIDTGKFKVGDGITDWIHLPYSSGDQGPKGDKGDTGDSGYSGYSGPPGTPGTPGHIGDSGYSGYSGASGISGISGYSGYSGYSGDSIIYQSVSGVSPNQLTKIAYKDNNLDEWIISTILE